MIIAYIGRPGSGKSLSALDDYVIPQLKKERHVYCNISGLDPLRIAGRLNVRTSQVNRYLHRFAMAFDDVESREKKQFFTVRPDGSRYYSDAAGLEKLLNDIMQHKEAVLVLDECHEYLCSENWRVLAPFKKYLSMARHYGHDIILITQHIKDIWEPLLFRIHETHSFTRGALGFRTHYRESVYGGWNVFVEPSYSKNRLNDKSLYALYKSHDDGAKEHMSYASIWRNKKLVALIALVVGCFGYSFHNIMTKGILGNVGKSTVPAVVSPVDEYNVSSNVIYVKYVVCGNYDCKATRPDGSMLTLPFDYASGKYPLEIRKYVPSNSGSSVPGYSPGAK